MFVDSGTQVYFVLGATDMRKGIDSLSLTVAAYDKNPVDGSLYVFCSLSVQTTASTQTFDSLIKQRAGQ